MGNFAMPVAAAPITRGDIVSTFTVTSTVVPLQQASLSSVISGNVLSVSHQIGEHVRKGELLVKIDDSTLQGQRAQAAGRLAQLRATYAGGTTSAQANLQSAKTAYDTAKANLERNQTLFNQGYVSKAGLDAARASAASAEAAYQAALVAAQNASLSGNGQSAALADLRAAQAAVQTFDAQIAQTNVSAPFDGIVTARNVDLGTLASPGTVLMQVAQLDPVFVDAGVSGSDVQYLRIGKPVSMTVDSIPGRVWHAQIAYLSLAAVPGTLTYPARVRVANPDLVLHGGMVANVAIERTRKRGVLLAPRAAVFQTEAGYAMFIIDQGKAKSIPVELGLENDQQAEVSGEGLAPGVMAILNHSVTLQPGSPVQPLQAGSGGPPGGGPSKASKGKPQQGKPQPGSS
ncbi:MAG TPA: efflux RND transporter periplasmic adaptor subunit [Candidatus Eremiobacteraceae bacterium]|nr:efflux RND transporter periplasmic adaptor subunit [Candidatus Eremiobacteraceae bacterium]